MPLYRTDSWCTSCAALSVQRLRLADRGVLKAGLWADLVVFDPETVKDLASQGFW